MTELAEEQHPKDYRYKRPKEMKFLKDWLNSVNKTEKGKCRTP